MPLICEDRRQFLYIKVKNAQKLIFTKKFLVKIFLFAKKVLILYHKTKTKNNMETVKLTVNEVEVLKAIVATGQREGALHYMVEDLVKHTGKSVNSIKGILSSLRKKYVIYCYVGEDCFDGEIREDAEEMVNNILNKVNSQNNKTEKDMETENKNPAVDDRIVRMNEIAATKLSSVSKNKRENLKAAKVAIKYILESWDCPDDLKLFINDKENEIGQYELWCIAKSRYDQLLIETAEVAIKANSEVKENDATTPKQAEGPTEIPEVVNTTPKKNITKNKRKIGDLHPNGKWIWVEYAPGKFDWRVNKHNNSGINRKVQERVSGEGHSKSVKKINKAKKQKSDKPVKVRTMDEILATKLRGIPEPQERAFKLLRKGYRIDPNTATPQGYTLIKGGKTMVIMEAVMNALINRLKVTTEEIKQLYI